MHAYSSGSAATLASNPLDLRFITEALSHAPFNKQLSVIALHDEMEHPDLVSLTNEVIAYIDDANPFSTHKTDIRNELPAATAQRMAEFLILALKFDYALHTVATLSQKILSGDDRLLLLHALYFLLNDMETHKKSAYLYRFCGPIQVPLEFNGEEVIHDLLQQLKERQEEFTQLVSRADQLNESSKQTINLKRDIHQIEEEKQQVLAKIQQLQRKVSDIPNSGKWLQAAKELRQEQQKEQKLLQQTKELKHQLMAVQEKLDGMEKQVLNTQTLPKSDPQGLMNKLSQDVECLKENVEGTQPKKIQTAETEVQSLEKALHEPHYSHSELVKLEQDVESISEQIKSIQERRVAKLESQDKLALYRQQAGVVTGKKNSLLEKLKQLQEAIEMQTIQLQGKKDSQSSQVPASIPRGEAFKQYVTELRTKSNTYKQRKAELHGQQAEEQVLQRTMDVLIQRKQSMQRSLSQLEQKQGVSGFTEKKQTLEKVSEEKGNLDEANEHSVQVYSDLVKALTNEILSQKNSLAPAIQELKQLRSQLVLQEGIFLESKASFDAKVVGLEAEKNHLESECQRLDDQTAHLTTQWHTQTASMSILDTTMDTVLQEMKASTEIENDMEAIHRQCGHSTWRDFLQRKCVECEADSKQLQTKLKESHDSQETNQSQVQLFHSLHDLLQKRMEHNQKYINKPKEPRDVQEILSPTEQRLVIS